MKKSFVFLAEGFEEIEALTTVDIMRRAGLEVATVSITGELLVRGAHGIPVFADTIFAATDFSGADWLIAPGGLPGSTNLAACQPLQELLKSHNAAGGHIAAICAAPAMVLAPLGILDGRDATGYPGTTGSVAGVNWLGTRTAVSGNVITGNGPASAIPFALAIVAVTCGEKVSEQLAAGLLC